MGIYLESKSLRQLHNYLPIYFEANLSSDNNEQVFI